MMSTEIKIAVRDELLQDHSRLIPFVGAGFTTNINEQASFGGLLSECASLFGGAPDLMAICDDDPARALDFVIWKLGERYRSQGHNSLDCYRGGKKLLYDKVDNFLTQCNVHGHVPEPSEENWEQHRLLVQCFRELITTNWDNALEQTISKLGMKCEAVYSSNGELLREQFGTASDKNCTTVIKFHGHLSTDPNQQVKPIHSLIASETDYYQRVRRSDPLDDDLICRLSTHGLLFLGYSLRDVNVRYVLKQVNTVNRYFARGNRSFWVVVEPISEALNGSAESDDDKLLALYHQFLEQDANIAICPLLEWNEQDKSTWDNCKSNAEDRGVWFRDRKEKIRKAWIQFFKDILTASGKGAMS
ncbi:MAG: SIR2 family protein [Anaerolineales bacterium]|nr:SIR2 family protein [Anaerolineales bacterium]